MSSMTLLWQRIESWLATHAPWMLDQLNPGATEADVVQAEAALGFILPEDFKASYRIHNGGYARLFESMRMGDPFFPLARVVEEWSINQELLIEWAEKKPDFLTDPRLEQPPIQPVGWHPKWIPFVVLGTDNFWCMDLDPAPGGQVGQVIEWDHETGPTRILSPSFEALFSQLADDLEAGRYLGFASGLERRLTEGIAARDQARRYDCEQPSPGGGLFAQALQAELQRRISTQQIMVVYRQVLQLEQTSLVDRFRAYARLIDLYHREAVSVSHSLFEGWLPNLASAQEIEATYRNEAEQVLAAFAAEVAPLPAEHWMHDDLNQASDKIFKPRHLLSQAKQLVTEGNLWGAYWALSLNLYDYRLWMTADERRECSTLMLEVVQRLPQLEQARGVIKVLEAVMQRLPQPEEARQVVKVLAVIRPW